MNPFRALQTSPKTANDLFAQIAETTSGAVKTRERLFGELKTELELLTRLEETYVLPVLKKNATKTLVAGVVESLKRTRELLAELEAAPRDGDEFAETAVELKRAFQAHVRTEKSDRIPALQKALSDDEAQTLVDRIEADRAEVEASARQEAEQRRADARREREHAEDLRLAEEAAAELAERTRRETARAAKAATEAAKAAAEDARVTTETGIRVAAKAAEQTVDRFADALRATGETTRSFANVAQCNSVLANGIQGASREWMTWAQASSQAQTAGFAELMQCRTPQDLMAVQTRLARESVERLMDAGGRVSEIAKATAADAAKAMTPQA